MKNNFKFLPLFLLTFTPYLSFGQSATGLQGEVLPNVPNQSNKVVIPTVQSEPQKRKSQESQAKVTIKSIVIDGNQFVSTDKLLVAAGEYQNHTFSLSELNQIASLMEKIYRESGYPFAQVYIPPQDIKNGVMHFQVLEGHFGKINATSKDEKLIKGAQTILNWGLKVGDPIYNEQLERTMLILDDQAGMKIHPLIMPGAKTGDADLEVQVERSSYLSGEVGIDNTGSTATGANRLHSTLIFNSPFMYGDKVTLNAMGTDQQMWLGSIDYDMPIHPSGWRAQVGYARTSYQLVGSQYDALGAFGISDVGTAKLSYPLIRSQATNVLFSMGVQAKKLHDEYQAVSVTRDKSSFGFPVSLQFDKRDRLLGGGVTYGYLTFTSGNLNLDSSLVATDSATANTQGSFNKINFDLARIQSTMIDNLSLYGRYSSQWANKNLDSSEKFNLGGFYGVRAYPLGEGLGDQGWFAQLELRYSINAVTPFIFYDVGRTIANKAPWDINSDMDRSVSAFGIGARYIENGWSLDTTVAWRTQSSGPSTSDAMNDKNPRFFVMLGKHF